MVTVTVTVTDCNRSSASKPRQVYAFYARIISRSRDCFLEVVFSGRNGTVIFSAYVAADYLPTREDRSYASANTYCDLSFDY